MARKRRDVTTSGDDPVIDDQEEVLTSVQQILEREGHRVLVADRGERAIELFRAEEVNLILVDYFMPRMTGEDVVAEVRKVDREVQIILQTGYSGEKPPREMLRRLEIQGYHDKTEGPDRLLVWVDVALKTWTQIQRIREAEALKSQILNNVSHEFRTPLHIVLGYTELLREDSDPGASETLDRIRRSAQSLLDLVNDFLHLSELDMGRVRPELTPLAMGDVATDLDGLVTPLVGEKRVQVACRVAADLPAVLVDRAKLQIVLRSLLSNAIKFTPAGAVTVTAAQDADAVVLTVRDSGGGIAEEHHERIFEPFFQVDGGLTRARDGAGVGLTIARRLARLMGGDITVDSTLGTGATFALRLPCGPAPVAVAAIAGAVG